MQAFNTKGKLKEKKIARLGTCGHTSHFNWTDKIAHANPFGTCVNDCSSLTKLVVIPYRLDQHFIFDDRSLIL